MKYHILKIGLIFIVVMGAIQRTNLFAQPDSNTKLDAKAIDYHAVDWSHISASELDAILKIANPAQIPTNAWGEILKKATWSEIPTNTQEYIGRNVDWSLIPINVLAIYIHPDVWPDGLKKQIMLQYSANLLRTSVDTNQLAIVASKMTNLPAVFQIKKQIAGADSITLLVTNTEVILFFEKFTALLSSNLNEFADYLTDKRLKGGIGEAGYEAYISNPYKKSEDCAILFWSDKGPVRDFSKQVGSERFIMQSDCYNNGKLKSFAIYIPTPKSKQHRGDGFDANFNTNGQLTKIQGCFNEELGVNYDIDATNNTSVSFDFRSNVYAK